MTWPIPALTVPGASRWWIGCAVQGDRALGDLAAVDVEQAGDGPQHGRLAGAVGPEEGHDGALRDLQADAFEDEDDLLVDDLEVLDREHVAPRGSRPRARGDRPSAAGSFVVPTNSLPDCGLVPRARRGVNVRSRTGPDLGGFPGRVALDRTVTRLVGSPTSRR
jgi:hypothetical protein